MSKKIKDFRDRQQVKEEQINFLLSHVEKNLEYEIGIEIKDKQLSDAKKILVSAKQSYDKTAAENKELKAYIENLKQHLQQQQQVQFLEKKKKNTTDIKNHLQKNIIKLHIKKKVIQVKVNLKKKKKKKNLKNNQIEKEPKIKKSHSKNLAKYISWAFRFSDSRYIR